jgi:putative PIN family toxin of toxin-antitoxin system
VSLPVPRRVVIDPNVLVSGAITPRGASARIIALIDSGVLIAVASPKLIEELAGVLRRPKFRRYLDAEATEDFLAEFAALSDPHPDPADAPAVSPDAKDDYLIALAQAAQADALVSGDPDLHGLPVADLRVLTPRGLLDLVDPA